ncbi:hypothetical protein GSS88_09605 [Corynebacterium sp. 3HC-13]|uniref:hypothetical protein n=1 Tax=Corynebacterium poyangense TaxID=2684405 RepID=UPI001CCC8BAE|nr:hypothetical protein [Corynebacterium poyangense]MBZ8178039.1 hypothetical protein [Corynebacterium poyangense]
MKKINSPAEVSTKDRIRNAFPAAQPRWRTLINLSSLLTRRQVKENKSVLVLSILIWIYVAFSLVGIGIFLNEELAHSNSFPLIASIFGMGTLLVIFWALFFPMMDFPIPPALLPTYNISTKEYFTSIFIGSLYRQRSILIILCTIISAIIIAVSVPHLGMISLLLLILGSLLSIILTSGGATFFTLLFSHRDRSFKEKLGKIGGLLFFIFIIAVNLLFNSPDLTENYSAIGNILQWTPLAAPAGIIVQSLAGNWLGVAVTSLISLATIGTVFWLSYRLIDNEVKNPSVYAGSHSRTKKARSSTELMQPKKILLPGLPWSPMAVVFSRAVRYMPRDSRVSVTLYTIPILGIFLTVQSYLNGAHSYGYFPPLMVAVLGSVISINDHGYDGPGVGLHILSGIKSRSLLVGRNLLGFAVAGYSVIITLVAMVVSLSLKGNSATEIGNIILHAAFFSIGIIIVVSALGLVLSEFNAYAVSQPGTSPYAERSGYRAAAMAASFGVLLFGWIPVVPGIILSYIGSNSGQLWLDVLGVLVSILIPVGLYLLALHQAVKKWECDQATIFQKVRVWLT